MFLDENTDCLNYSLDDSAALVGISTEVFTKIFVKYVNGLEEKINNLENFIINNDFENISILAHTLKGSSGNMNVIQLYNLFRAIELSSKEKKQTKYENELITIHKIHKLLKKII